jgi:type VI secretion system secreted protein Hcp
VFDAFLKIQGIDGESTDDKHKNWIEVLSFSWGVSQPSAGSRSSGGAASGQRPDHSDFSIVKSLDKASPLLFKECNTGKHVGTVTLALCRNSGKKAQYMEYKMEETYISGVRPGGAAQGSEPLPLEEVSFNYGKITLTYNNTDHATGEDKGVGGTAWWSVTKNAGG